MKVDHTSSPKQIESLDDYDSLQAKAHLMSPTEMSAAMERHKRVFTQQYKKKYKGMKRVQIMKDVIECIKKPPKKRSRFEVLLLCKVFNQVRFF